MGASEAVPARELACWLEHLYLQVGSQARAVARRITGRGDDAEDVVQDAFLAAWHEQNRFDVGRGSMAAWILSIVRSRALDRLRNDGTRKRNEREAANAFATSELQVDRCDEHLLHALLDELADAERSVLRLAYFLGFTQAEIARRTGIPLGTVKSHARRGLKRLARMMMREPMDSAA